MCEQAAMRRPQRADKELRQQAGSVRHLKDHRLDDDVNPSGVPVE